MKEYNNRLESLRSVESFCYSLCIHILVEEALAWNAARLALLDLYQDELFWQSDQEERKRIVRKKAVARALEQAIGSEASKRVD
ncbi:hypothetical protein B1A99_34240 [Cohnella sp. CIP 111063]|jgi:hypothetical protein|uniref:hypothetical protein n=1 Tax=unclassified Cohnella TaxID=2636738 RepID=UPI000B8BBAEB|nr:MULTISPECIES: hypothetical protein [unclassified Cohnella]OXS52421.1 hypothetical protein B1A99_34240 [Cohnella sp. CIP 111063]PRX58279.1 hypothetical protein B0G52_13638 [Cohnella sp. SGD-V74]